MWQFVVYILIFIVLFIILRKNLYTLPASILISSVFALIVLSLLSRASTTDLMNGDTQSAVFFVIAMITMLYVTVYAFYKALGDKI